VHTRVRPASNDTGETLVELIIAVAIMGIVVVAIVGGIGTTLLMSDLHRKQATAGAYLRNYAETLQASYAPCTSGAPDYAALLTAPVSGFSPPTATVRYWDTASSSFSSSCPPTDSGLQQITLTLAAADSRATESLVVVVRQP
jgi:type II secretory pathway pseudopilin PulG